MKARSFNLIWNEIHVLSFNHLIQRPSDQFVMHDKTVCMHNKKKDDQFIIEFMFKKTN